MDDRPLCRGDLQEPSARKVEALPRLALLAVAIAPPVAVHAQGRGGPAAPPPTARASAPIDLTGYWVAVVNEDWRFRMVTPGWGDYGGGPITKEALQIVNNWDPAADEKAGEECKSYGAAAVMRLPARLHITWQDDTTLKVEVDAGTQTRVFRSWASRCAAGTPTWQGDSTAQWERGGGRGAPPVGGSLTVVTRNMRPGYLRKNGVPQRERDRHGAFRPVAISWWPDARRHHGGRRSAVSTAATHRQLAFQEGSGRFQMGSHAMFSQMVTLRRSALVVLALLASASSAFAQFEIVGRGRLATPKTSRVTRIQSITSACR